ncbi:MAG: hypothetical protein R2755_11200 [Acidimicrobiales bacterium]
MTSWTQYEQLFGGFLPGAMLPHSVYSRFQQRRRQLPSMPASAPTPSEAAATLAPARPDRAIGMPVEIAAKGRTPRSCLDRAAPGRRGCRR